MDDFEKKIAETKKRLEELYLKLRAGEPCTDEVVRLSREMDSMLLEKAMKKGTKDG